MSKFEAVKVLNRILNRLCQIDRFGYFALPVTESEAPGYYSVIEKPMCFSIMREKIDTRQYRTWGAFLRDFNLMLRNALYFNDKKSVVYRIALLLNKEGNERLKEVDVEGRQAVYLLHPGGPAAAAEEEAREFEERDLVPPLNPFLIAQSETPKIAECPLDIEQEDDGQWTWEENYSSFSETESEGDMRGQGCPSVMKMQNTLNDAIEKGVRYEKWKMSLVEKQRLREDSSPFRESEAKRTVKQRCLWLQLRMQELQSYVDHYSELCERETGEETVNYKSERSALPEWPFPPFCKDIQDLGKLQSDSDSDAEDSCEEESYPGRLYIGLSIMAEEITKLTALLASRQRISQSRMITAARPIKKSSSLRKKPATSSEMLEPKRSRRDFDHPLHHSESFGGTVSVEKPVRMNIAVPGIVEIAPEKSEKWENAKRMLKQSLEDDPTATMPEEVMQALQLSADEGSSEEDISDALYLTKHQQMEVAERERHLCVLGGLDPKRRKLPEKRAMRSASLQTARAPAKRGRGRGRGAGRPGRPPNHRRSAPDLLSAIRPPQPWITSLPVSHSVIPWSGPASTMLPFPVYSTGIDILPSSMPDVTCAPPTTTPPPSTGFNG